MKQFQVLANAVTKKIPEDELSLDFTGFNDFIDRYNEHISYDADEINEIIMESSLWNDYLSEVLSCLNIVLFSNIVEYEAIVSSRDRSRHNLQEKIKEKIHLLKALKKELYTQKRHCNNIYYSLMKEQKTAMKAFSINDYVN